MARKTVTLQPAEKHMDPGQVKLTVSHEITEQHTTSSTVYLPEVLLYMLPSMIASYQTNPQWMTGNVVVAGEESE